MPNTNCLEGIKCPKCGAEDKFNIEVRCFAEVTDDGTETYGDNEWDDNSRMQCCECEAWGELRAFRVENQTPEKQAEIVKQMQAEATKQDSPLFDIKRQLQHALSEVQDGEPVKAEEWIQIALDTVQKGLAA